MVSHNKVQMIKVDSINILNPRERNKRVFGGIAHNIVKVGLKKPITVTPTNSPETGKKYDLVCGQGRLEAFMACEQDEIPALISDANEEQALIMSLVENLARRQNKPLEVLRGIDILKKQGYGVQEIEKKTGLSRQYIRDIIYLLDHGEERLLSAVESGQIPINVAIKIAETPQDKVQDAMREAYESGTLRGKKFLVVQKLLEVRKSRGKSLYHRGLSQKKNMSANDVVKIYQREVDKKKLITKKAEFTSNKLMFVVGAMKQLFREEQFCQILRDEKLDTIPKQLMVLIDENLH